MTKYSKIIKAGLLVGTFDISGAFIHFFLKTGKNPVTILPYIASALFGKEAFTGGNIMFVAGLIFHYIIAFSFTLFFFWIFPALRTFIQNKILTGIIYGIFIWSVMQFIVLPLTKIPIPVINPVNAIISTLVLIVCIGIPLSYMGARYYDSKSGPGKNQGVIKD